MSDAPTRERLSFTANDIEALIAALLRVPEVYQASLKETDREIYVDCLEYLEDARIIPMGATPEESPIWQNLRDFRMSGQHNRQTIVNVLGVLYICAWGTIVQDNTCRAWAENMYSDMLDTLDIELI